MTVIDGHGFPAPIAYPVARVATDLLTKPINVKGVLSLVDRLLDEAVHDH